MKPNAVLCGPPGAGKSTVGRLLAARLGRPFVDLDIELEQRLGAPIAEVFATRGEGAFRAAEAALVRELASFEGHVLAVGGGAVLDAGSRAALEASGVVVCLWAGVDELARRHRGGPARPLLPQATPDSVRALLRGRRAAYRAVPHHLDTEGRSAERVVDDLVALLAGPPGAMRIEVRHPGGTYPWLGGTGLLAGLGDRLIEQGLEPGLVAVVTDARVGPLHGRAALEGLRTAGFAPVLCTTEGGEQHKTLDAARRLYDAFLEAGLDRRSAVVALGGGVVGDLAGFAAATFLRGVPLVQVPTTVLAMVDASVGGKVAVDLPQGKNLVGAFWQPTLVAADVAALETLPDVERRAGLAEVVKHAIIGSPALFEQLEDGAAAPLGGLIGQAVRIKVQIVECDPHERGRRAVLNLGHTFGHALEQVSGYGIRHGEAVAIGLVAAARLGAALGRCDEALAPRIAAVLEKLGLPTRTPELPVAALEAAMGRDKKRRGGAVRFVVPERIGAVVVVDAPVEAVRAAWPR